MKKKEIFFCRSKAKTDKTDLLELMTNSTDLISELPYSSFQSII